MRPVLSLLCVGALLSWATCAAADPYVDYMPQKGVLHVTVMKVDPNHVDDYLVGLKKSWVPAEQIARKHGIIDYFGVNVKLNSGAGANVVLIEHYPSIAALDPDQARDQAIQKEILAVTPKEQGVALTNGFDKYREFVSDDYYQSMDLEK